MPELVTSAAAAVAAAAVVAPELVMPSTASSQLKSAAAPSVLRTPTEVADQRFTPLCFSPYSLEFMRQVLRRGKVLTDLIIHLLVSGDSPEYTLEVLDQRLGD
ncbi:hypothetical protein GOODEAATRI_034149 [Goodea atripinnis]|uniref:Secreted protein n=1 Tax=Goodea atripinnis TaxID=208336 RepID=A0ABV0Q3B7_9TELE